MTVFYVGGQGIIRGVVPHNTENSTLGSRRHTHLGEVVLVAKDTTKCLLQQFPLRSDVGAMGMPVRAMDIRDEIANRPLRSGHTIFLEFNAVQV